MPSALRKAFWSLFERGVGVGRVRAGVDQLDLLLALQMGEVLAAARPIPTAALVGTSVEAGC